MNLYLQSYVDQKSRNCYFLSMPYKKQVVYLKKQKTFLRFFPKTAKFLNKIPTL